MSRTDELYGSQDFDELCELGAIAVYEKHIEMLETTLTMHTASGNYKSAYEVQKAQNHWRTLIQQAMARR